MRPVAFLAVTAPGLLIPEQEATVLYGWLQPVPPSGAWTAALKRDVR